MSIYLYDAKAVALAAIMARPFHDTIHSQANCSLSIAGGEISSRAEKFDFKGVVSFDSAQCDLVGAIESRNGTEIRVSRASSVIERLNLLNIVTADRIVVHLTSEHLPRTPEPRIVTTGSHFDNLRIAGYPVTVGTAHDVFQDLSTYDACQRDWRNGQKSRLRDMLMGSTLSPAPGPNDPDTLREIYQGLMEQSTSVELRPTLLCSFVTKVNGINGSEIKNFGPIIVIPQFGTVYLGEVVISAGRRRLDMLRLELGSPVAGTVIVANVDLNGTWYP